ncbi:dTDP-4-dehydrorhamnose reductase [Porticoccus sp.]|uniref:dTDP-4-dehydrorhamnose reductase n=1 Tax=Porticoccus sp. TaxID=2024853 RepID=UPI003F6A33C2
MKILVTGADGQLGRCLQDRLRMTAHDGLALNRSQLDITDQQSVKAAVVRFRPDVIVNAAAYTAVDRAESEPEVVRRINAEAVGYLAEAANKVGALLVQVSTDYVFDGRTIRPYRESDPVNPLNVYGASKLAGEQYAAGANRYFIVRTAWLFSEYGNNFLKSMLKLADGRETLQVVADQIGTPTYAGDLAVSIIRLAEAEVASGIYNYSGGRACSWFEFSQAIFACLGKLRPEWRLPEVLPVTAAEYSSVASRPAYTVLDDAKLRACLPQSTGDWELAIESLMPVLAE